MGTVPVFPQIGKYYVVYDAMGNQILVPFVPTSRLTSLGQGPSAQPSYQLNHPAQGLHELSSLHQSLLGDQSAITTGENSTDPDSKRLMVRKPWLDAPEGASGFDPQLAVSLPAVNSASVMVTHTVPEGSDGVINAYSWNYVGTGFTDGSGDIIVSMLRNGTPIRNYSTITVQKGCIQIPRPIAPLRIYSNQVIQLVATHAANAGLTGSVVASLVGYDYPSRG